MAGWNTNFVDGVVVGFECPDCQTREEWAEATINEATIDYSRTVVLKSAEDRVRFMISKCERVLRDFLQEVADGGETLPLDFEALITRVIETLPPQLQVMAADNRSVLRKIFEDIWSGKIYKD